MIFCTDIILCMAFVQFPELAHVVFMPAPIELAVCIIGACLLAGGVVGIHLKADSFYNLVSAPVCRALPCRRLYTNCVGVCAVLSSGT